MYELRKTICSDTGYQTHPKFSILNQACNAFYGLPTQTGILENGCNMVESLHPQE
jgi:hypothetical protein